MEYMSSHKDQNGISHPRMTLNGILKFAGVIKSEYFAQHGIFGGRGAKMEYHPFIVCTPISYLVGSERIFDDVHVTANNSNEYVTIKVDRHVVLAYT